MILSIIYIKKYQEGSIKDAQSGLSDFNLAVKNFIKILEQAK